MPLFSVNDLRNELETKDFRWQQRRSEALNDYANRKLNERAENFYAGKTYDIFLSHSVKDNVAVLQLAKILENYGMSVYVDWIVDRQLNRSNVTRETARVIRERLKNSKSLLLALTSNSATSSWVQWELGLGDGQKNGKVAIIPLTMENDPNPNFYKQEYLGLYPYVDYLASSIWVNGKIFIDLKEWISEANPLNRVIYG